ncbi:glucose-6-phosphate dehydrogenase, partial [Escherichia coli]|nr:glucose-6-phosphate dehydrogenase [Escherichia coli]
KPHAAKASGNAFDEASWKSFLDRIEYVHLDLGRAEDYVVLRDAVASLPGIRVFYLATGPSLFVPICKALAS